MDPREAIAEKAEKKKWESMKDLPKIGEVADEPDEELESSEEEEPEELEAKEEKKESSEESAEKEDASEPDDEPTEDEQTVTLKVDGVEVQVPLSKIIDEGKRSLQKESAANKRLEEATRLRHEYEEMLRTAKEGKQSAEPKEQRQERQILPPDDIRREIAAIERKMYVEGVATEAEFNDLYNRKMFLQDSYFMAMRQAEEDMAREVKLQQDIEAKGKSLVSEVQKKHPDFVELMYVLDAEGRPLQNHDGTFELQHDLRSWLDEQPPSKRNALLASLDPRDPIWVLDEYKSSRKAAAGFKEKAEKKRQMDVVQAKSAKAKASKTDDDEEDASAYVKRLKAERTKNAGL